MCHSEFIFYTDQITINNENSINDKDLIANFIHLSSSKNIENSIIHSDVENKNNKNQEQEKNDGNNPNYSVKKFSNINESNLANINPKNSQKEKNEPFYTKIWFITTIIICVAIIIAILIYHFKK